MGLLDNWNLGFSIFLALFIIVSLVHLYFCFKMIPLYRKVTKPLCLLFLGTAFLFLSPSNYFIWISCYLSMIGDLLLIKNKVAKYFIVGAIIFALAHTLNAINQISLLPFSIDWLIYVIVGFLILFVGIISFCTTKRKENKKAISAVGSSYACFHLLNIVLSIILLVNGENLACLLILGGYIVYVISDFIVNYVTNKHDIPRRDFYIMITYLLGQCSIYFGLAMCI